MQNEQKEKTTKFDVYMINLETIRPEKKSSFVKHTNTHIHTHTHQNYSVTQKEMLTLLDTQKGRSAHVMLSIRITLGT